MSWEPPTARPADVMHRREGRDVVGQQAEQRVGHAPVHARDPERKRHGAEGRTDRAVPRLLDTAGLAQREPSCRRRDAVSTVEVYAIESKHERRWKESHVLTLTDSARTAVHTLTSKAGLPDETGGLRIAQQQTGEFELALVPEPLPGDDVVTDGTSRVYVDPEASVTLADQRLDVEPAASGTAFTLGPQ